jgi:hypothetical protein
LRALIRALPTRHIIVYLVVIVVVCVVFVHVLGQHFISAVIARDRFISICESASDRLIILQAFRDNWPFGFVTLFDQGHKHGN